MARCARHSFVLGEVLYQLDSDLQAAPTQARVHKQLPVSVQRHALVEYEQPEDACRAVAELTDTGNWCGPYFRSVHSQ